MTDQNYTHIVIVLDSSGSMKFIEDETQQALSAFVNEQKLVPGKATLSYYTFNGFVNHEFSLKNLEDVSNLRLIPNGLTALHDAMGYAIETEGGALANLSDDARPGKVIVVVITDGYENASKEYTSSSVKALVEEQTNKYGWEFVFLGANQDAVLTAGEFGIDKNSTLTYAATAGGVGTYSRLVSSYVTTTRSGVKAAFTDADRSEALDSSSTV